MISEARLMNILRSVVTSEKSTVANERNVFVFKVLPDASKEEIKAAVEKIFGVQVLGVRTLNFQGKKRRTIHGFGRRSDWKKAYISIPAGQSLDFEAAKTEESK